MKRLILSLLSMMLVASAFGQMSLVKQDQSSSHSKHTERNSSNDRNANNDSNNDRNNSNNDQNYSNNNDRNSDNQRNNDDRNNSDEPEPSGSHLLAKVYKVDGVEVYIMNEPLRKYQVVCDVTGGLKWGSYLTGGLINPDISQKVSQFVRRALKQNNDIDAVVYESGKHIVGVRFTSPGTRENSGIARVHRMNGVPLFVMCEPVDQYRVNNSKGGGIKWKSIVTAGLINNSIEEDVDKMASRVMTDQTQGIICSGGKHANSIEFQ